MHFKTLQNQQQKRMSLLPPQLPPFYTQQQQIYNQTLFPLLQQQLNNNFEIGAGAGESMCSKTDLNSSEFLLLQKQNQYNDVCFFNCKK